MDKNDVQTLIHLIKSQSEQTRKELTNLFRSELKSESEQSRKELTNLFRSELKSESEQSRKELTKSFRSEIESKIGSEMSKFRREIGMQMNKGFSTQKEELVAYLDEKFEDHRRTVVDEIQTFEDNVITEIRDLRIETSVNSFHRKVLTEHESRISKLEKRYVSN